jgi:hypothetical protein
MIAYLIENGSGGASYELGSTPTGDADAGIGLTSLAMRSSRLGLPLPPSVDEP